jgi:hypothetical protein
MSEIVSPESKLYVKEEVEKAKKEIKEDIEKANSKAARTFTIVGVVLGILTGVGVYGLAARYIDAAIVKGLEKKGIQELMSKAEDLVENIEGFEDKAQESSEIIDKIRTKTEKLDSYFSRTTVLEDQMKKSFREIKKITVEAKGYNAEDLKKCIKISEGFCYLGQVKGKFMGNGEYVKIYQKKDYWMVEAKCGGASDYVEGIAYAVKYPM